jgi:hypothetical protein
LKGINTALLRWPRHTSIQEGKHVVGAGIAGNKPQSLIQLRITVRFKDRFRIFKGLCEKLDCILWIFIPPISVNIPMPGIAQFSDGMVKNKG